MLFHYNHSQTSNHYFDHSLLITNNHNFDILITEAKSKKKGIYL